MNPQAKYYRAFNEYLTEIRKLYKQYSRQELIEKFSGIDYTIVRLAKETGKFRYSNDLNPLCVRELHKLNKKDRKSLLRYITKNNPSPQKIRAYILERNGGTQYYKPIENETLKNSWLNDRQKCNT